MRTLICSIIPNNLTHVLKVPQAANNFCLNLFQENCFNELHSIVPINYYSNQVRSEGKIHYYYGKQHKRRFLSVINLILANINAAISAIKFYNIWFYNISKTNILCYVILRYVFRKNTFIILLDYTPINNKFSLQYYVPYLLRNSKGVISLSSRTKLVHDNIEYIAGIIPTSTLNHNLFIHGNKRKFLFSGVLGKHTGVELAIECFKCLPDAELYITGIGEYKPININEYKNIKYLGYLPYSEYLKIYNEVDICLSFRDPNYPENNNNFPSKILEYFAYNKIVLSTIDYVELSDFKYFRCNYDKKAIIKKIKEICSLTKQEFILYKDNIRALKNNFSEIRWQSAMTNIEDNVKP
jgi:glycosyltransferase involved in cell wall biosynthesis